MLILFRSRCLSCDLRLTALGVTSLPVFIVLPMDVYIVYNSNMPLF